MKMTTKIICVAIAMATSATPFAVFGANAENSVPVGGDWSAWVAWMDAGIPELDEKADTPADVLSRMILYYRGCVAVMNASGAPDDLIANCEGQIKELEKQLATIPGAEIPTDATIDELKLAGRESDAEGDGDDDDDDDDVPSDAEALAAFEAGLPGATSRGTVGTGDGILSGGGTDVGGAGIAGSTGTGAVHGGQSGGTNAVEHGKYYSGVYSPWGREGAKAESGSGSAGTGDFSGGSGSTGTGTPSNWAQIRGDSSSAGNRSRNSGVRVSSGSGMAWGMNPGAKAEDDPDFADMAPFSAFNWIYGGFRPSSDAKKSGVSISGIKFKKEMLSFSWESNLSAWGIAYEDPDALACLFVKNNEGEWVGGKFEWISSSRGWRGFENVFSGYNGWNLDDVPNPALTAFLVMRKDGRKRSNILVGMWER